MAALALLLFGVFSLIVMGAAARFVPGALCPDVPLLFSVVLALRIGGARALLAAAGLGAAADLLSGAPFGLSVLLALVTFAVARAANGSLELRRPLATAALVAALTPLVGVLGWGLVTFFGTPLTLDPRVAFALAVRTAANFAGAPLVEGLALLVSARAGDEDLARRTPPLPGGRRAG